MCFTSHRQRGHLETAPQFTVPCEGREARFIHRTHRESNHRPSCGSPLLYRCATPAPSHTRLEEYSTLSTELLTEYQHNSIIELNIAEKISRSGLTQDIKIGSCVFQCDVPHQQIAQQQVNPVSVSFNWLGCYVLRLQHGISVWQHIGQSTTATCRHCCNRTLGDKAMSNPNKYFFTLDDRLLILFSALWEVDYWSDDVVQFKCNGYIIVMDENGNLAARVGLK